MAAANQKFCLQWNDFRSIVTSAFYNLRQDEDFVDVTLCCEGRQIRAHKMMLSACSPFFKEVLKGNPCQHPVFFLKDVSYRDLAAVIEFVYTGEVSVTQSNLSTFIKTAEMLQVKGLANEDKERTAPPAQPTIPSSAHASAFAPPSPARPNPPPPPKRPLSVDAPSSPSVPKRCRAEPTPPAAASPPNPVRCYPTEWSLGQAPKPPPPPPPAAVAAPALHERVAVKTEAAALDDGHGMESAMGAPDPDYAGMMDFKGAQHTVAAGVEEDTESQDGAFFSEEPSSGQSGEAWPSHPNTGPPVPASEGRLACESCGKTYSHRRSLHQHEKVHQGKTTCTLCGDTLSSVRSLKCHMKRVHLQDDA